MMADVARRSDQDWQTPPQRVVGDDLVLSHDRADACCAVHACDALQCLDLIDIDEDEGLTHPQCEKWHECLTTGKYRRTATCFGEQLARLFNSPWCVVV